jgi:DNA-binding helix-hairpin-helix protein with protein kinase domain
LTLGREIGRGGEATIYNLSRDPHLVAKIYHPAKRPLAEKLRIMLDNPPEDPMRVHNHTSIAWMTDLVHDTHGQLAGYLMPKIRGGIPIHKLYNPGDRRQHYAVFTWKSIHRVALNLATVVASIHARGYVIGDLNESNILVHPNALVSLVDTDSFQVSSPYGTLFRCLVGKPEYTAPEIQGRQLSSVTRTVEHDNFALGVLIFQLLMEGSHPFRGSGDPPELARRIRKGMFPYKQSGNSTCQPPPLSPPFQILHPEIRQRFSLCFVEGHRSPCRPTASDWVATLRRAEACLIRCSQNRKHFYLDTQRQCPWCKRTRLLGGRDPFPESAQSSTKKSYTITIDDFGGTFTLSINLKTVLATLIPAVALLLAGKYAKS